MDDPKLKKEAVFASLDDSKLKRTKKKDWKTHMSLMVEFLRRRQKGEEFRDPNVLHSLKKFREIDLPFMKDILDKVGREGLLEKRNGPSSAEKAKLSKLDRAKQGFVMGRAPYGGRVVKGGLFRVLGEFEKRERLFLGFLKEKKGIDQLANEAKISRATVRSILRDPLSKGEYYYDGIFCGSPRGDWVAQVTPEQFDEVQSMLNAPPGRYRLSKHFYFWKAGNWLAKPNTKEIAKFIFKTRIEKKSSDEVISQALAKEGVEINGTILKVKISGTIIGHVIHDRRVTGKIIVDGEKKDSGFERLIDEETWEKAQKIHVPHYSEVKKDRAKELKAEILAFLPAYRWELRMKFGFSLTTSTRLVDNLKEEKLLEERDDGLLKNRTLKTSYPETVLATNHISETRKIKAILKLLYDMKGADHKDLLLAVGCSSPQLQKLRDKLKKMGVLERTSHHHYKISDNWVERVGNWLSQPHIAKL